MTNYTQSAQTYRSKMNVIEEDILGYILSNRRGYIFNTRQSVPIGTGGIAECECLQ